MKTQLLPPIFLLTSALCCVQTSAQITYSTVALDASTTSGVPVPTLTSLLVNAVNSKGEALVLGKSGSGDALWAGTPGALQRLAADDEQAPGTEAGAVFLVFDEYNFQAQATDYSINSAGQVVLRAALRGSATTNNNLGLWVGAPGALQLVARNGSPAPETEAGTVFLNISPGTSVGLPGPTVNASGQVAFAASLGGPSVTATNGGGLWMGTPGSLKLIQRGSANASSVNPVLNDAGQVAFFSSAGITTGAPGATQLLVRFAVPAPGLSGATNQGVSGQLAFNNAGQVAFASILTGSVNLTNNRALWLAGNNNALSLIARTGTQAPGVNTGVVFSDFSGTISLAAGTVPVLNGVGQVAFLAKLAGPGVTTTNDFGIWLATSTGAQLVAREGEAAPGTPDGVKFGSISTQPALNDKGQIAFQALLVGPGVTGTNNTVIYVGKPGALQVAARTGTQIDAGNGVAGFLTNLRTLYAGLGSSQGGHSPGIGEDGQVLFSGSLFNQATFGNRNAVLMATPGAGTGGGSVPRILSIVKIGNDVAIRFTTEAGKHYVLEFKEDLSVTSWSVLPGDLTAAGTEGTITDSITGKGATRFYRVKVL